MRLGDNSKDLSFEELETIIQFVYKIYEFDFSQYSKASLKRRFERLLGAHNWDLIDFKTKLTNEPNLLDFLIKEITVNVTEMFRDPEFFRSVKKNIIPYLDSYQRIKIWNAGVSTGEELYSFSILFKESRMYNKSFFYGTDINSEVLKEAKEGIYSIKKLKAFTENYNQLGFVKPFSDYFAVDYNNGIINSELRKNCLFSVHNLVSDHVFNEFQLVSCRNVLIYFDQELQTKVIELLVNSLCIFGFLCLGSKEVIRSQKILSRLKLIDPRQNIYQRIK
ncbi:MAG: protein-glutamate O-methyltransferase CheR [Bacteroidetes bacterium]|nr:protein-glutamate O-methyltransferase CheR [Bacteroidota bacterium]MBU1371437.1 protein-glutamate O-methyltransferase CheR [Bacteroidota bacterium]MBU1484003.1 protein-glutamate O-methyltransferase CheR [Bacteroidota bacterium]MBU1760288.1 protein-glutamate O-methyltransferase CheR [Bacteroidota bacterium]MBU2267174.1 protein-glutamate O-methyltransferase CheR [Bacteroidota bacterium]